MGDHIENIFAKPHRQRGVGFVGFRFGKHYGQGNPTVWSDELTPSQYADLRGDALQSQAAFDDAAATMLGNWYMTNYPTAGERAEARQHVLDYNP